MATLPGMDGAGLREGSTATRQASRRGKQHTNIQFRCVPEMLYSVVSSGSRLEWQGANTSAMHNASVHIWK